MRKRITRVDRDLDLLEGAVRLYVGAQTQDSAVKGGPKVDHGGGRTQAHVPEPLLAQLAPGGRMVIPVGQDRQSLTLITRGDDGITRRNLLPVLFVPMTGEAERR